MCVKILKTSMLMKLYFLMILSGCAFGPFMSHETARTVGASNHEFIGGYGQAGYVLKWNYGLTENFDIGLQYESFSIGARAKYAFLNQSQGWSVATAFGLGNSIGGDHYYIDLMTSHQSGAWEPYATFRYVKVKTEPVGSTEKDNGVINLAIGSMEYDYGQGLLGTKYWFTQKAFFSVEVGKLVTVSSSLKIDSGVFASAALGYRF